MIANRLSGVILVLSASIAGITFPFLGTHLHNYIPVFVMYLIYVSLADIKNLNVISQSKSSLILLSLLISYLLLPVIGINTANQILHTHIIIGFTIALLAPTTAGSAIIWSKLSGANVALTTVTSVVSIVLSPIITPALLYLYLGSQGSLPFQSLLLELFFVITGGIILALILPDRLSRSRFFSPSAKATIFIIIYASVSDITISDVVITEFVHVLFFSVFLLLLGAILVDAFRRVYNLSLHDAIPIYLTSNLQNLGIAIVIGTGFGNSLVMLTIISYFVCQQLCGAIIADVTSEYQLE